MPRFYERRTWNLLEQVPPNLFTLVRGALSLRQKVVIARQSLIFLKRCRATGLLPQFIRNKKLGSTCCLPENHPKIIGIYKTILGTAIKQKQYVIFSSLKKCERKEEACRRLMNPQQWRRIESASKGICDLLRSKTKSDLCEKFERLRVGHHQKLCNISKQSSEPQDRKYSSAFICEHGEGHCFRQCSCIRECFRLPKPRSFICTYAVHQR